MLVLILPGRVPHDDPPLAMQGKCTDAEPLYPRSRAIREKLLGPGPPDVAQSLNHRAGPLSVCPSPPSFTCLEDIYVALLFFQGKRDEADPLYARAIAIGEKVSGPNPPGLAVWLHNRAVLLKSQVGAKRCI